MRSSRIACWTLVLWLASVAVPAMSLPSLEGDWRLTWALNVRQESDGTVTVLREETGELALSQEGEQLRGILDFRGREVSVEGTFDGERVAFSAILSPDGTLAGEWRGRLEEGRMSGTYTLRLPRRSIEVPDGWRAERR